MNNPNRTEMARLPVSVGQVIDLASRLWPHPETPPKPLADLIQSLVDVARAASAWGKDQTDDAYPDFPGGHPLGPLQPGDVGYGWPFRPGHVGNDGGDICMAPQWGTDKMQWCSSGVVMIPPEARAQAEAYGWTVTKEGDALLVARRSSRLHEVVNR